MPRKGLARAAPGSRVRDSTQRQPGNDDRPRHRHRSGAVSQRNSRPLGLQEAPRVAISFALAEADSMLPISRWEWVVPIAVAILNPAFAAMNDKFDVLAPRLVPPMPQRLVLGVVNAPGAPRAFPLCRPAIRMWHYMNIFLTAHSRCPRSLHAWSSILKPLRCAHGFEPRHARQDSVIESD